jgi:radical SAM superfamily enzyme YgiQ (UPF0313 family)
MRDVHVLLVSTYDLGRQPFGLASPAAWLRRAGAEVECVDASRDALPDEAIGRADVIAFYLPMHTATRLAAPLIARVRTQNPAATLAAYGLYAPLNEAWLRDRGVAHVLGPEAEGGLVDLVTTNPKSQIPDPKSQVPDPKSQVPDPKSQIPGPKSQDVKPNSQGSPPRPRQAVARLQFIQPDRSSLPPLDRYARLQMPDGTRRTVGSTDATRGCKHLCRHCPIVPVYRGAFRVVPVDVVMADVRAQVQAGAAHISFGDPDFFNGPTHARRIVEALSRGFPSLTYDVTIKIEHLLAHADLLPLLRDTGCLLITSAVESIDDQVLAKLRKGHTRHDFVRAVTACREAGVALSPTFVPFTPWTTLAGYAELLEQLAALDLEHAVAPVQLGIRLLVTAESALLELPDIADLVEAFDAESLTWPWRHPDPRVDALQRDVMQVVATLRAAPRHEVFRAVADRAGARDGGTRNPDPGTGAPFMTESWYCCAEPLSELV